MWINDLVKNGADPHYIKQVKSLFDLFKERRCMFVPFLRRRFILCGLFLVSRVDLQDRDFLSALANHAQALARIILNRSNSGVHLAEDAQVK